MFMVSTCMLIQLVIMSCNDIPIDRFIDVFDKHIRWSMAGSCVMAVIQVAMTDFVVPWNLFENNAVFRRAS